MQKSVRTYSGKERNAYLAGMLGQNIIYNVVTTGLVGYYLQSVIYLPVVAIGWIVAIARVWDAINDPMMGVIVDRTKSKWGKCRPYLIFAPVLIGAITILTFVNGNYAQASETGKVLIIVWAAVSYILWGMLFTVCDIPLWGLTSLMTEDEHDRSKLLGLARIFAGIGGLGVLVVQIAQAISKSFIDAGEDIATAEQRGFLIAVVIFTVLSTILFEFAGLGTKERVESTKEHRTFKENFKLMWQCKPFRQILVSGILRSPIQILMLVAMSFVTYYYANGNIMNIMADGKINWTMAINIIIVALGIFAGQFAAMAVTPLLIKKFENKKLYNFFSAGGAVPFFAIFIIYKLADGDVTTLGWSLITGVAFLLASASMGGINVLQSVMIADCVDYEEYNSGLRPDGVFFSGQSFITKLSGGIAILIQTLVYSIVGFSENNIAVMKNHLAAGESFITYNKGEYAAAMFFLLSIPIGIGMLLSALPTLKYALSDKEHDRILEELVKRRGEKE